MLRRQLQVPGFPHFSPLLSSMLASLSSRLSLGKQDGGHQFSNPQTGFHWSGLGQGQSLTQSLWPEMPYLNNIGHPGPSLETGMRLQLPSSHGSPKGNGAMVPSSKGQWGPAGNTQSDPADLMALLLLWVSNLTGKEIHMWIFFPRRGEFF